MKSETILGVGLLAAVGFGVWAFTKSESEEESKLPAKTDELPEDLRGKVEDAVLSEDPTKLRSVAKELGAAGYPAMAAELTRIAVAIEAAQGRYDDLRDAWVIDGGPPAPDLDALSDDILLNLYVLLVENQTSESENSSKPADWLDVMKDLEDAGLLEHSKWLEDLGRGAGVLPVPDGPGGTAPTIPDLSDLPTTLQTEIIAATQQGDPVKLEELAQEMDNRNEIEIANFLRYLAATIQAGQASLNTNV